MHLIKVPGVFNDGEMNSISLSPCNSLILSGGKYGYLNVWDTMTLINITNKEVQSEEDFKFLKPISTIPNPSDDKLSSIKCVRFSNLVSNTNQFVASYDNGKVYKFELLPDGDHQATLMLDNKNSTIVDISWSFDDELIALASITNEIIIYDFRYGEILDILKIHADMTPIKGIKFDNLHGNFLCSIGNDKLINIIKYDLQWNKSNNKLNTKRVFSYKSYQKMNKLINSNPLNSNSRVRRLDWSQDDKLISIPNSNKGKMSLVNILFNHNVEPPSETLSTNNNIKDTSGFWKNWCSLVGHNFNCEVTKFNPNIFINKNCKTSNNAQNSPLNHPYYYVIATAGSDKTLAIWNTSVDSPIIVAQDITTSTILDICWNSTGDALFLISTNGEFIVVTFGINELGEIKEKELPITEGGLGLVKILKNWTEEEKQMIENQSQEKKDEIELKEEEKIEKIEVQESAENLKFPTGEKLQPGFVPSNHQTNQQKITDKNGKKRIRPMLISSNNNSNNNDNNDTDANKAQPVSSRIDSKNSNTTMEFDAPSYAVSKNVKQMVRKQSTDENDDEQNSNLKKRKKELIPVEFIGSVVINPSTSFSNVRLSIPKIRKLWRYSSPNDESLILVVRNGNGNETGPSRVSLVRNQKIMDGDESNSIDPEVEHESEIFVDFLPKKILLSAGGEGLFWAIGTVDGNIIVYSDSGKRILPPIILGTPLSFLESKGNCLMAVTCIGEIFVWDISLKKALFEPTSLYNLLQPLTRTLAKNKSRDEDDDEFSSGEAQQLLEQSDILSRAENLTLCSITSNGIPVVTLSNGNGYLYNSDMCSWSLISDSWWAFGSEYWDTTLVGGSSNTNVVSLLERHTNEEIVRKGKSKFFNKISKIILMKEGYENLEVIISLNHLENKILIYEYLKDYKNLKNYLLIYFKKLNELNFKNKIIDLLINLKENANANTNNNSNNNNSNTNMNAEIIREILLINPRLSDLIEAI
ncbi:hypothetical protein PACTADRAFT_32989 [Pachysolen tannophilus NRRL Y-2460]|uniref:Protein HIR n=1 Tax=Pachysolen tannophilus NRRL Y-2460 TaxID=669874 RepID=A0A1E4TVJ8_PACTA|nr:hypothetical protein PACTADRAFT_32989 [Pachysolen tannophilus NRRL Y-2460]